MGYTSDGHRGRTNADTNNTFIGTDAMVAAFVQQWRRGERLDIAQFLGNASGTRRAQLLVALISADLAERIPHDPTLELESYLVDFPELGPAGNLPLQLILAEYNARLAQGCKPNLSDYERRFPQQFAAMRGHLDGRMMQDPISPGSNSTPLAPGTELGDFKIVRLLGQGGMSRVYLACQLSLDRPVALKVTPCSDGYPREEARTLAQLSHDHIVPVYVEQIVGDQQLMAMRYIPGVTLSRLMDGLEGRIRSRCRGRDLLELIDRDSLSEPDPMDSSSRAQLAQLKFVRAVCQLVVGLARGLEHAHRNGVLHRDIKPANILVAQSGRAMLMDFNIASRGNSTPGVNDGCETAPNGTVRQASRPPVAEWMAGGTRAPQALSDGAILGGTPAYMAPEQLAAIASRGATDPIRIDARSDIYSLGAVFYEFLSGTRPLDFQPEAEPIHVTSARLLSTRSQPPPPIPRQTVRISAGLDSILEKCLAPEPAERYQSAAELAEDLERYVDHRRLEYAADPSWYERAGKWLRRHPRSIAAAVTALVLIICGAACESWLEHSDLRMAERLVQTAYSKSSRGEIVGAYEDSRRAELLVDRSNRLLPLLGFRERHETVAASVRTLDRFLPTIQYHKFHHYSSLARGGQSLRPMGRAREIASPVTEALLAYQVLERWDWQQLPHFQALDPESQAEVEAFMTEMIIIRVTDLIVASQSRFGALNDRDDANSPSLTRRVGVSTSDRPPDAPARANQGDVAELLLSRVPEAQKGRYAVLEAKRLVRGIRGSDTSDNQPIREDPSLTPQSTRDRLFDKWDPFDLYLMGVLDAKLGRFESASKYFDLVLDRAADDEIGISYWARFHRAYCAEQAGDVDSAIADYATCIGLDNQLAPYHNLGLIYARQEKFELAAKYLREASRRGGGAVVSVLVNLAAVELKLGNLPQALDAANDAIGLDDHCADAYANRGATHAAMGHSDLATADLNRALELDQNCGAARRNLDLIQKNNSEE